MIRKHCIKINLEKFTGAKILIFRNNLKIFKNYKEFNQNKKNKNSFSYLKINF